VLLCSSAGSLGRAVLYGVELGTVTRATS